MRSGHSTAPENWENLYRQGDFELGFERWADIFPEKEELAIPAPPTLSHPNKDTESQFDQIFHSQLSGKYLMWVWVLGLRQDFRVDSLKGSQSFHDPMNFRGGRDLFLVGREEFLGWTGCGTVSTWRSAAASHSHKQTLSAILSRLSWHMLQLWKDEDKFSPVIDVSSFPFVSLPQRLESFCVSLLSGAEKCVLKRSSGRLGKGIPVCCHLTTDEQHQKTQGPCLGRELGTKALYELQRPKLLWVTGRKQVTNWCTWMKQKQAENNYLRNL